MYFIAFVLAVAGAGLSLVYSGAYSMILQHGTDITWLKEFASFSPEEICVLVSSALAALGALLAVFGKKFAAVLLVIAAGTLGYAEIKLGTEFPYCRAAAVMFAAAGALVWLARGDKKREDEEYEETPEQAAEAPVPAAESEPEPVAVPAPVTETAVEEPAAAEEPEPAEAPAPAVEAPADVETDEPKKCTCKSRVFGLLLGLAGAAYALYMSGVYKIVLEHGADVEWLKGFASFDLFTQLVLATAALAIVGGVFALLRIPLASALLMLSAIAAGVSTYKAPYAYSLGAVIICFVGAITAWSGKALTTDNAIRRYTCAYIYAFIFGIAGVAFVLKQSGLGCELLAKGFDVDIAAEFAAMECGTKALALIAASGAAGSVLALLGIRISGILLLASMFLSLAAEIYIGSLYTYSWAAVLIFAVAAMLATSYVSSATEKVAPVKSLTAHAAFLLVLIAAVAGGAAAWQYSKLGLGAKIADARSSDPEYIKLESGIAEREAKIAELTERAQQQETLIAERDAKIAELDAQIAANAAEASTLAEAAAKAEAQAAELASQLEESKAQLSEAKAEAAKKYLYVKATANVRDKPTDKGSKVLTKVNGVVLEILDAKRPSGSSGYWYQVKGSFGTGWIFGKNVTVIRR